VVVGELDGRQTERLGRVHAALLLFEPNAITTDNIWGYLWGKMGYGALLFASALTPASIVEVLDSREARPALTALAREVTAVAAAEGVTPMGFNGYDPAAFGPGGTGATIDASLLKLARRHGVAVPRTERLVSLMQEVESGARPQVLENMALLAA
jgi:2-dehydropantoate 2-reductase